VREDIEVFYLELRIAMTSIQQKTNRAIKKAGDVDPQLGTTAL